MTLFSLLYLINCILTSMIAGFMISYVLTLGSYFTHMVRSQKAAQLQQTYTPFRAQHLANVWYMGWLIMQFAVAALSLALQAHHYPLAGQVLAVIILPMLLVIHFATGFAPVEKALVSGKTMSKAALHRFVRFNLPLHRLYAVFYSLAAACLVANIL